MAKTFTCHKKFEKNDLFYNRIKTHPQVEFFIYDSNVYLNNKSLQKGKFAESVPCVPTGYVSLHEINVDRSATGAPLVYPYVIKTSDLSVFNSVTVGSFGRDYAYGAKISGQYPLSASITRKFFTNGMSSSNNANTGSALKNTFNYYKTMSPYYEYSSSIGSNYTFNKDVEKSNLICIPSIFYGSSIKKGTVSLKYYISGTLVGQLEDVKKNGELVQTGPVGSNYSGSTAGVVLYNEGFLYLTGAWTLNGESIAYDATDHSRWVYFGAGAHDGLAHSNSTRVSASYSMAFSGTNYIPTLTMLAHAEKGELNHSNNATYIEYGQLTGSISKLVSTSSVGYLEKDRLIKNTVSSSYLDPTGSFEKITYISKIGIYDKNKELIGIASVATPVKKTPTTDYTFKLKLDF
jgi:hypothetical protein